MPDAIDAARNLIEARLREIAAEVDQLSAALTSLGANSPTAVGPSPTPTRRRRKRARKGQRARQILAAVKANPGATPAQLARRIGISTNQAYALAAKLHKEGRLTKSGGGYRVPAAAPLTTPRKRPAKKAPAKRVSPKTSPARARRRSPSKARSKKSSAKASRPPSSA